MELRAPSAQGIASEIQGLVRATDEARYLSAQFAPPSERQMLLCLYAFDVSLEHASKASENALVCELRLAWWQEAVAGLHASQAHRGHPILQGLLEVPSPALRYLRQIVHLRRLDLGMREEGLSSWRFHCKPASATDMAGLIGNRLGHAVACVLGFGRGDHRRRQLAAWMALYAARRACGPDSQDAEPWVRSARECGFPRDRRCIGASAHLALARGLPQEPKGLALRCALLRAALAPPRR